MKVHNHPIRLNMIDLFYVDIYIYDIYAPEINANANAIKIKSMRLR